MLCRTCGANKPIDNFYWRDARRQTRRQPCKSCHAEANARNYQRNPEANLWRNRKHYWTRRRTVLLKLGGKCVRCGFDDPRALEIDHISGNGQQDRDLMGPAKFYKKVIQDSSGFQLLCSNCNSTKRFEQQEWAQGISWWDINKDMMTLESPRDKKK